MDGRLANKSYNGAFLSGPKWFVCHGGLGTLLLRYLREQSKGQVSPAWTSQEIYVCVAKESLDKSRGNQPRPRQDTHSSHRMPRLLQDSGLLGEAGWD